MVLHVCCQGPAAVIKVGGKVGWENARLLDREVKRVIEAGCVYLVFNLDEIDFLSSGAIGVLVYHLRKLQKLEGDIFVVTTNEYVLYLFQTIGFNRVFEGKIFHDFEEFSQKILVPKGVRLHDPLQSEFNTLESHYEDDEDELG